MFKFTGVPKNRHRSTATLVWDDGIISGDFRLVEQLKDDAKAYEGRTIGFPDGPQSQTEHLSNPYGAAWLMAQLFKPKTLQVIGNLEWPELPEGSV